MLIPAMKNYKQSSIQHANKKLRLLTGLCLLVSVPVLESCFLSDDTKETKSINNIKASSCAELNAEQQRKGDSLVALASAQQTDDMQFLFSEAEDWKEVKQRSPAQSLALYEKALTVAPGHCGALFGKAVAKAMMVTQDPELDKFVTKMDENNSGTLGKKGSLYLFKTPVNEAAPALLKFNAQLQQSDPATVREVQKLIETAILPRLDSAIASFEKVLENDRFFFDFYIDNDTVRINNAEIGPGLAGLKVARSFLVLIAAYDWEVAIDNRYDWFDTLENLKEDDFDHLSPGQLKSLDHLTSLFDVNSPFSKIRTGWQKRVEYIPSDLLSAVGDAQKGLRSAIDHSKNNDQDYRLYRVGNTEMDDVDTLLLADGIELLERSKKYLKGEVNIEYNKGRRHLKVNFANVFKTNGLQKHLPYFKFRAYTEWNDTLSADTSWFYENASTIQYQNSSMLIEKMGLPQFALNGQLDSVDSNIIYFGYHKVQYSDTVILDTFVTVLTVKSDRNNPCKVQYVQSKKWIGPAPQRGYVDTQDSSFEYSWQDTQAAGSFTNTLCSVNDGEIRSAYILDVKTKGPFYFTDAADKKTLDAEELFKNYDYDNLDQLTGLIVFRDPTFGGVFPEITNQNIWITLKSFESIEPRTKEICTDEYSKSGEYSSYYDYKCTTTKPKNPSDLDLLLYLLYRMDDFENNLSSPTIDIN